MTDYHLGQFVACVDDNLKLTWYCPDGLTLPRKGQVYRIRTIDFFRARGLVLPFLRLDEIVNPLFPSVAGPFEPVFEASAFLPLDPKRLDVFREQLAPVPA